MGTAEEGTTIGQHGRFRGVSEDEVPLISRVAGLVGYVRSPFFIREFKSQATQVAHFIMLSVKLLQEVRPASRLPEHLPTLLESPMRSLLMLLLSLWLSTMSMLNYWFTGIHLSITSIRLKVSRSSISTIRTNCRNWLKSLRTSLCMATRNATMRLWSSYPLCSRSAVTRCRCSPRVQDGLSLRNAPKVFINSEWNNTMHGFELITVDAPHLIP